MILHLGFWIDESLLMDPITTFMKGDEELGGIMGVPIKTLRRRD